MGRKDGMVTVSENIVKNWIDTYFALETLKNAKSYDVGSGFTFLSEDEYYKKMTSLAHDMVGGMAISYTDATDINNKIEALKVLGYKYITREPATKKHPFGRLCAWFKKPIRSVAILCDENETPIGDEFDKYVEKYGKENIYLYSVRADDIEENDEVVNNIVLMDCGFTRHDDNFDFSDFIDLKPNDSAFKHVTWENSPVEI